MEGYRQELIQAVADRNDGNIQMIVNQILNSRQSVSESYQIINFTGLIRDNNQNDDLHRILMGIQSVKKYAKNLLRYKRPDTWSFISFNNTFYQEKISFIQGITSIFESLGYTEHDDHGFHFPAGVEPDINNIQKIVSELQLAEVELIMHINNNHPKPESWNEIFESNNSGNLNTDDTEEMFTKGAEEQECSVCGEGAEIYCQVCEKFLCKDCNERWHGNPRRQGHEVTFLGNSELSDVPNQYDPNRHQDYQMQQDKTQHLQQNQDYETKTSVERQHQQNQANIETHLQDHQINACSVINDNFDHKNANKAIVENEPYLPNMLENFESINVSKKPERKIKSQQKQNMFFINTDKMDNFPPVFDKPQNIPDFDNLLIDSSSSSSSTYKPEEDHKHMRVSGPPSQNYIPDDEINGGGDNELSSPLVESKRQGTPVRVPLYVDTEHAPQYASLSPGPRSVFMESWQCEHCTYHNQPKTRVCEACSKTGDHPLRVGNLGLDEKSDERAPERHSKADESGSASDFMSTSVIEEQRKAEREFEEKRRKNKNEEMCSVERDLRKMDIEDSPAYEFDNVAERKRQSERQRSVEETRREIERRKQEEARREEERRQEEKRREEEQQRREEERRKLLEEQRKQREELILKRKQREMEFNSREIIKALREAEDSGLSGGEIDLALHHLDTASNTSIIDWAGVYEPRLIDDICRKTGTLSKEEAKAALIKCKNVDDATDEGLKTHIAKREEIQDGYGLSRQEMEDMMINNNHDILAVERFLFENRIKTMLDDNIEPTQINTEVNVRGAVGGARPKERGVGGVRQMEGGANANVVGGDQNESCQSTEDRGIYETLKLETISYERKLRMLMAEFSMGFVRAENVLKLLSENESDHVLVSDVVDAVQQNGDLKRSKSFLQKECSICYDQFPHRLIYTLNFCSCLLCKDCIIQMFTNYVNTEHITRVKCPTCEKPESIEDLAEPGDYFSTLCTLFRHLLGDEVISKLLEKVKDWILMRETNFRWCSADGCEEGFIYDGRERKMICPKCGEATCFECKKPWTDQHENLTCEEYQRWREDNDPELQELGLAKYLEENGITCPSCKQTFSLARGGCMHFICSCCKHQFCLGCQQPFKNKDSCKVFPWCIRMGLHAHHPRNCLFYLRDSDVEDLQRLLEDNQVSYLVDDEAGAMTTDSMTTGCQVMEQKETVDGLTDAKCGKPVEGRHAGLCEIHYKEYLVTQINRNRIDPVAILSTQKLCLIVKNKKGEQPERRNTETDNIFRHRVLKIIKDEIPLPVLI